MATATLVSISDYLRTRYWPRCRLRITELRVRVSEQRIRILDLCLIRADAPEEQVVETAPLLCIEILSPKDTIPRVMLRSQDFLAMVVPEICIFDSARQTVRLCTATSTVLRTAGTLQVPGTTITLSIEEVFATLDKKHRFWTGKIVLTRTVTPQLDRAYSPGSPAPYH